MQSSLQLELIKVCWLQLNQFLSQNVCFLGMILLILLKVLNTI